MAIKNGDADGVKKWRTTEEWGTVDQLIKASDVNDMNGISANAAAASGSSSSSSSFNKSSHSLSNSGAASTTWICPYCTYNNQTASENCEICHLPR